MCRKKWVSPTSNLSSSSSSVDHSFCLFQHIFRIFLSKYATIFGKSTEKWLMYSENKKTNEQTETSFVYKIKDLQFVRNSWIIFVDAIKNESVSDRTKHSIHAFLFLFSCRQLWVTRASFHFVNEIEILYFTPRLAITYITHSSTKMIMNFVE